MSTMKLHDPDPDAQRTCTATRAKMTAALTELARLHSHRPLSHDAFAAAIQRIADEHAQPCGCELLVQHNADGLVQLHLKVRPSDFDCEVCQTIECFFHPRAK
jgi:hypothetical protein